MHIIYKVEYNGRIAYNLVLDLEHFKLAGFSKQVFELEKKKYLWTVIREKRDSLITETDWTQILDNPLSEAQRKAFATYRKALRDIPTTYSDPEHIIWPEKPTL